MLQWNTRQLPPPFQELYPSSLEQGSSKQGTNRPTLVQHGFRTINSDLSRTKYLSLASLRILRLSQYNLTICQKLDPVTSVIMLDCFILFWNWNDGNCTTVSIRQTVL